VISGIPKTAKPITNQGSIRAAPEMPLNIATEANTKQTMLWRQ
jgi:hypothetical protein